MNTEIQIIEERLLEEDLLDLNIEAWVHNAILALTDTHLPSAVRDALHYNGLVERVESGLTAEDAILQIFDEWGRGAFGLD